MLLTIDIVTKMLNRNPYIQFMINKQARGNSEGEKLPEMKEKEILRGTKLKRQHIFIWVTPDKSFLLSNSANCVNRNLSMSISLHN